PSPSVSLAVRGVDTQAFVFAKGILEDAGFGWRVSGPVHGYAGNKVVSQSPAPGTHVIGTGAPMIILTLARGPYAEKGTPEDSSSYRATAIKLAGARHVKAASKPAPTKKVVPAKEATARPKPKPK